MLQHRTQIATNGNNRDGTTRLDTNGPVLSGPFMGDEVGESTGE